MSSSVIHGPRPATRTGAIRRPGHLLALLGLALALTSPGCQIHGARAVAELDPTSFTPAPGPLTVDAHFVHGDMVVRGGDGATVEVEARATVQTVHQQDADLIARDLVVDIHQDGDKVWVGVRPAADWSDVEYSVHVTSTILVPRRSSLDVGTTHGDVEVEGVAGDVRAESTHGDLEMRDVGGNGWVRTTHGDVVIDGLGGTEHDVRTTHGDVDIRDLQGSLSVDTTHGDVVVELGRVEGGSVEIETTHGSITCDLSPSSHLSLEARTSHDDVHSEFEGTSWEGDDRNRAHLVLGQGTAQVVLRTTHDAILLRRQDT